jgi:hypothetical protein
VDGARVCRAGTEARGLLSLVGALRRAFLGQGNGRSRRHCSNKCRRRSLARRAVGAHVELCKDGGARMVCARAKVSMMSIGAPQCRHTKVGGVGAFGVLGSLGSA